MDYNSYDYYASDEYKKFMFETDMLNGNINRICVTDDLEECQKNYKFALDQLKRIYEYRCKVIAERAKHEQV